MVHFHNVCHTVPSNCGRVMSYPLLIPPLVQELGLDEVERLLRRPRNNAKERLVEVLLELVASCK